MKGVLVVATMNLDSHYLTWQSDSHLLLSELVPGQFLESLIHNKTPLKSKIMPRNFIIALHNHG
jgi:hypothetical protein